MFQLGQGAAVRWVADEQLLFLDKSQRRGNGLIDITDSFRPENLELFLGFHSLYPAAVKQFFVKPLKVQGGELAQGDAADVGLDVVVDVALVGLV